ncbi:MAG: amidohydrolase family protein [Anaerolineales bacterium]|nr:amidohydrolase family protein [Anaerolineales bacterium]MDW8226510.1 amidohydrolase family protein [Anaerolineales bacterium]
MKKVDFLLTNALVLTMDEEMRQFSPGAVAVLGDTIVAVGEDATVRQEYTSEHVVDCGGKVVMPGLINAHTHVPMTLMRGLADDLRLDVWLQGYMWPVEREFVSPDFVRLGTKLACAEMLRSGVTCFADMYFFEADVAAATAEAGMRAVCSQTVLKFPAPDARSYEDSLAAARQYIQEWKNHPLIVPSVAPHAPYTCTAEILRATAQLAVEFDVPLHIHLAETALEVETMRREHGMPVIPYVKKQGLFDAKVLAAHCVHVDEGEMRTMLHAGAGVAHNPSSNLKLASGFAPVQKMLEVGLNVGIGTDGPASNNDLDMFEEIRLAALVAKAVSNDPTAVPASRALLMATRMGAKALHIEHLTGSLEVGKRADLILVDLSPLHNSPRFRRDVENPYAQLVYAAKASDVTAVMVNGKWLMVDRQLLTLNEAELTAAAQEYAHRIDVFLMARESSVFSKLVALGGSQEEESFEVQVKVKLEDPQPVVEALKRPEVQIVRFKHYHQHDVYFSFEDRSQGWLRYREDEIINEKGQLIGVRSRLTLIGPTREGDFAHDVLLSRIRYFAPAANSLRFYREYFKPARETPVDKDRLRWLVRYQGVEFYVNLDRVETPPLGYYLEVKSRTWSRRDAEMKARLASELIVFLGGSLEKTLTLDYVEMAEQLSGLQEKG